MNGLSFIKGAFDFVKRLYMQFIIILVIAFALAVIIEPLFSVADFKLRIFFSALFLLGLAGIIYFMDRY